MWLPLAFRGVVEGKLTGAFDVRVQVGGQQEIKDGDAPHKAVGCGIQALDDQLPRIFKHDAGW